MTSFRTHVPTACISASPAAASRSKNPSRAGLNRIAVGVGRSSAFRNRALPDLLGRVRPRTPGVYLGEMGIDGTFAFIPKGMLKARVKEIERLA